jgi:hypothetical protein
MYILNLQVTQMVFVNETGAIKVTSYYFDEL